MNTGPRSSPLTKNLPPRPGGESRRPSGAFKAVVEARRHAGIGPQRARPRVIVAGDDPEMRRLLVEALRKTGYETVEAADGGRLLFQVSARFMHPSAAAADLIISDIRMPVCNGIAILRGLRHAHWTVPVILMTAFGDDETRASVEALGGILFHKPFAVEDLLTAAMNLTPAIGR